MTKDFLEKANECKSVEEIKELVEKERITLTDEELKEIAGGIVPGDDGISRTGSDIVNASYCPYCLTDLVLSRQLYFTCSKCGFSEIFSEANPKRLSYNEYMKRKRR